MTGEPKTHQSLFLMKEKPIIGVLITSYGHIDPCVYHNHISCLMAFCKEYELICYHISGVQQPQALNMMTQRALTDGCDYLFYLEHDNLLAKNHLKLLVEDDKDVVSGIYNLRRYPFLPVPLVANNQGSFDRMEYIVHPDAEPLLKVDVACFGCCLVKADVMKQLPKNVFICGSDAKNDIYYTTDIMLFNAVKKLGYDLYVDGRVRVGHVGDSLVITPDNADITRGFFQTVYPELVQNEMNIKE